MLQLHLSHCRGICNLRIRLKASKAFRPNWAKIEQINITAALKNISIQTSLIPNFPKWPFLNVHLKSFDQILNFPEHLILHWVFLPISPISTREYIKGISFRWMMLRNIIVISISIMKLLPLHKLVYIESSCYNILHHLLNSRVTPASSHTRIWNAKKEKHSSFMWNAFVKILRHF